MSKDSTTPQRGSGHYSDDGSWWWDDDRQRWYATTAEEDLVEIDVEDYAATSWVRRILTTVLSQFGTLYFQFVAQPRNAQEPAVLTSATFPALPLDDLERHGAFSSDIEECFRELQERLAAEGWLPAGHGAHWWSAVYRRPRIAWDTPEDAYPRRSQSA